MKVVNGKRLMESSDFRDWELVEGSLIRGGERLDHCSVCQDRAHSRWCRVVSANLALVYGDIEEDLVEGPCPE